jgi:putative phage-type endonuclease
MVYDVICDAREEGPWLNERRNGVGASEAAAILGLNPWSSDLDVWSQKLGLTELEQTEQMGWGLRLEPVIARAYSDETGRIVKRWGKLLRSKEFPFMQATPDYRQSGPAKAVDPDQATLVPTILEVKNVSGPVQHWEGGVPEYVQVQVQHQLAVTGHKAASVAALLRGGRLVWQDIDRDQHFISEILIPEIEKFWGYVERQESPPADGSVASSRALKALFPEESGETIALEPEFVDLDIQRERLREDFKLLEHELRAIDNKFKQKIGDNSRGICPNGIVYTYRTTKRPAYEVAASSFRALRRSAPKE